MTLFLPIDPSILENCFPCGPAKTGVQMVLGLAGFVGLVTSVGVLPFGVWFQVGATIACALVSTFTIWNALRYKRVKKSSLVLVIKPDGSAVSREDFFSPVAENLLLLRFAWRGQRSARLVFSLPNGEKRHCHLYRRDLNASQWRCLCRWILWLERGQKPS